MNYTQHIGKRVRLYYENGCGHLNNIVITIEDVSEKRITAIHEDKRLFIPVEKIKELKPIK